MESAVSDRAAASRRELAGVLLLVLVSAGGLLLLAGRAWLTVRVLRQPPFGPVTVAVHGRQLHPALTGLAVVGLLAGVLVLVTGGWARRALGVLLLATAVWTGWYAVAELPAGHRRSPAAVTELIGVRLAATGRVTEQHPQPAWAWLSLLCSVLLAIGAALLLARAGRWRQGLSRRHQVPAEAGQGNDPWRQLDRGEDPTIRDG